MKVLRSQSSPAVNRKRLQSKAKPETSQQPRLFRKLSFSTIKNRRSVDRASSSIKQTTTIKHHILQYIAQRSDVQIVEFYNSYKEQFFRKSNNLQNLFYRQPQIKHKYLHQQDIHFNKGFQHTLLTLFRKGAILPGEYRDMRQQVVEEIQKWVFSWVKRKSNYERAVINQYIAQNETRNVVIQIAQWAQAMKAQKPFF